MEPEIWGQRPLWECLAWALSQDLSLPPWGPCGQISLPSRPNLGWRAASPECRTGESLRVPGWGCTVGGAWSWAKFCTNQDNNPLCIIPILLLKKLR